MDITIRKRLSEWIHRMIYTESTDRGHCVKLNIRHVNAAGVPKNEIGNIIISAKVVSPEEIPVWTSQIDKMTVDDSTGIGGMNRYAVTAYFKPESDDPERPAEVSAGPRLILRVDGGSEDGDGNEETGDMQSTEAPTQRGLTTQLMRHLEVQFKVGTAATAQTMAALQRENARLTELVESYMVKQVELITTVETMHTQRHERELASATALMKQDALRELMNKGMHLLPMIVNSIAKKRDVLPANTTPIEQMVHSLVATLTPKQMEGLLGQLNTEQQATLLSVAQAMFKFEVKSNDDGTPRDGTERANQNGTSMVKA
jgi:hypothetical protein